MNVRIFGDAACRAAFCAAGLLLVVAWPGSDYYLVDKWVGAQYCATLGGTTVVLFLIEERLGQHRKAVQVAAIAAISWLVAIVLALGVYLSTSWALWVAGTMTHGGLEVMEHAIEHLGRHWRLRDNLVIMSFPWALHVLHLGLSDPRKRLASSVAGTVLLVLCWYGSGLMAPGFAFALAYGSSCQNSVAIRLAVLLSVLIPASRPCVSALARWRSTLARD